MTRMTLQTKLAILSDAAKYDASCASSGGEKRDSRKGGVGSSGGSGICHAYTPDGRCISLLKILMTNFCVFDCSSELNSLFRQRREITRKPRNSWIYSRVGFARKARRNRITLIIPCI